MATIRDIPHTLLGDRRPGDDDWHATLDTGGCAFLLDHQVAGRPVLPGAVHVEIGLAVNPAGGWLRDIRLRKLLPLNADPARQRELRVSVDGQRLTVSARRSGTDRWTVHADTVLKPERPGELPAPLSASEIQDRCPNWRHGARFYRDHERTGNSWRGAFRGIVGLWNGDGEALARLRPFDADGFRFHPAGLDACLQLATVVLPNGGSCGVVLASIDKVTLYRAEASGALWAHARRSSDGLRADITVFDAFGTAVAELNGVRAQPLTAS